jgi:hypothetical protein
MDSTSTPCGMHMNVSPLALTTLESGTRDLTALRNLE